MGDIKPSKKEDSAISAAGTFLIALCCFTPLLVVTLWTVGLSAFTPYLDYVLYPALAIMIFLIFSAYKKYKSDCETCRADNNR